MEKRYKKKSEQGDLNEGFGVQLSILNCKMSSTITSDAPDNILSECYIGMWGNDMGQPTPTKLETSDIMDLIEPSVPNHGAPSGPLPEAGAAGVGVGAGSTSPTTIIHHTGIAGGEEPRPHPSSSRAPSPYHHNTISVIVPSTSPTSSSPPSSSSSTQYLASLPSLSEPYGTTTTDCHHLLDGFHSGVEPPFHKLSESHPFQDGGYDAFISDLSQQPTHHHSPHQSSHTHHQNHHLHHSHEHSQVPPSHLQGGGNGLISSIDGGNGVLLLDVSQHHHHHHNHPPTHDGQCSPGCPCAGHPYTLGGDPMSLDLCHRNPVTLNQPHHHSHHYSQQQHVHQDYTSAWDDIPCESAGYPPLFRKSPSTSDSVSYTDNDTESKSSGGSFSTVNEIVHVSPPKRKVGRPPKKDKKLKRNEKKTGRLWEFIRDLLKNPEYCPSLVKWENHEEGHFRFVNSEKVAQLWGQIKNNPRMTYEKLSRAMRYYYKSHVFEPVLGRRLVYKFGYNATNWKPINPNFVSTPQKMYN